MAEPLKEGKNRNKMLSNYTFKNRSLPGPARGVRAFTNQLSQTSGDKMHAKSLTPYTVRTKYPRRHPP
jgi:hypothetical protein